MFTNSGLFANYSQQVDQLKGLIAQNPLLYAPGMILDSMILFLSGGSDYTFFAFNNANATVEVCTSTRAQHIYAGEGCFYLLLRTAG